MNVNEAESRTLAELLGRIDALYVPVRNFNGPHGANAFQGQVKYRNRGLPWKNKGTTGEQQRSLRVRDRLCRAGLLKLHSEKTTINGVSLTAKGDYVARMAAKPAACSPDVDRGRRRRRGSGSRGPHGRRGAGRPS